MILPAAQFMGDNTGLHPDTQGIGFWFLLLWNGFHGQPA
jgi:hypothetical protein